MTTKTARYYDPRQLRHLPKSQHPRWHAERILSYGRDRARRLLWWARKHKTWSHVDWAHVERELAATRHGEGQCRSREGGEA